MNKHQIKCTRQEFALAGNVILAAWWELQFLSTVFTSRPLSQHFLASDQWRRSTEVTFALSSLLIVLCVSKRGTEDRVSVERLLGVLAFFFFFIYQIADECKDLSSADGLRCVRSPFAQLRRAVLEQRVGRFRLLCQNLWCNECSGWKVGQVLQRGAGQARYWSLVLKYGRKDKQQLKRLANTSWHKWLRTVPKLHTLTLCNLTHIVVIQIPL